YGGIARKGPSLFRLDAKRGRKDHLRALRPASVSWGASGHTARLGRSPSRTEAAAVPHWQRAAPIRTHRRPLRRRSQETSEDGEGAGEAECAGYAVTRALIQLQARWLYCGRIV